MTALELIKALADMDLGEDITVDFGISGLVLIAYRPEAPYTLAEVSFKEADVQFFEAFRMIRRKPARNKVAGTIAEYLSTPIEHRDIEAFEKALRKYTPHGLLAQLE